MIEDSEVSRFVANDFHAQLAKQESQEATYKTSYEKFIEAVEAELGHSLDGVQWIDGYSLDYAREFYEENCRVDDGKYLVIDYVKRVREDKADAESGNLFWVLSNKQLRSRDEDGDESRSEETIVYCGKASDERVETYIDDHYGSEHCQHEYDCCGKWYASRGSYKRRGELLVITQSFYQNI